MTKELFLKLMKMKFVVGWGGFEVERVFLGVRDKIEKGFKNLFEIN